MATTSALMTMEEFRRLPEPPSCYRLPWSRVETIDDNDNLRGAPDFVIEVAFPSNSAEELQEIVNSAWRMAALRSGSSIRTAPSGRNYHGRRTHLSPG